MTGTSGETELKIIEAAIACIEKYGYADTTVRKIAAEAAVNVAAVNYYFGSKDELIDRALEISLQNAFDWDHFSKSENAPPVDRLCDILDHIGEGAYHYPELTRLHFFGRTFSGENTEAFVRLKAFLERIYEDLTARNAKKSGSELRFAILQAVSATVFSFGFQYGICSEFAQADLKDDSVRMRFIRSLVEGVLG